MTKIALPISQRKRRLSSRKKNALSFINSIESTWKGHEPFVLWLVKKMNPKTVVDLGFDRGLSTLVFGLENKGHVFGIDWFGQENYATKCFALDTAFRNISNALRFQYAKNIHLIVGPFEDIAKKWNRSIDILHIDLAHSYESAMKHYINWKPYLSPSSVVIVHDILAYPEETGKFFQELKMHKFIFPHSQGLGVASENLDLIEQIRTKFAATS